MLVGLLQHPYEEWIGYKQLHKGMGRWMMQMVNVLDKSKRKTISLARYNMSVHLGRLLNKSEQVDHIDEDKSNDDISNLQLLTAGENSRKHVHLSGKHRLVNLKCPVCGVEFTRQHHKVAYKIKHGGTPACSRKCGAVFGNTKKS